MSAVEASASICSAAANASSADACSRVAELAVSSARKDDINFSVTQGDRIAGEPDRRQSGVPTAAHIELVAVPWTNDVDRVIDVMDAEALALAVEPLLDLFHQPALADRTALVRARVAPSIERAVQAEHADL